MTCKSRTSDNWVHSYPELTVVPPFKKILSLRLGLAVKKVGTILLHPPLLMKVTIWNLYIVTL